MKSVPVRILGSLCLVIMLMPLQSAWAPMVAEPFRVSCTHPAEAELWEVLLNPWNLAPVPAYCIDTETLWLARLVYSETKRPPEQELVAWVVRNRADTGFRGRHTIEAVAQDPYQFSALRAGSLPWVKYTGLTALSDAPGWQRTLALAYYVRHADPSMRPFEQDTRHFYSEQSLAHPDSTPAWAAGLDAITPDRPTKVEPSRFRFFAGVY